VFFSHVVKILVITLSLTMSVIGVRVLVKK